MKTRFEMNPGMFMCPQILWQSAWIGHIPFVSWLVHAFKPRKIVELGTHTGTSYLAVCQAVEEASSGSNCYAVDTWAGDVHAGPYGADVYERLSDYHRKYAGFSRLMRMTFDEAVHYFDDASIDLLHIDGLHTYDAVKHDYETWEAKLSDRGLVLFHDINVRERDFGVWRFWAELRGRYPSFEFSHSNGLGVIAVGAQAGLALQELFSEEGAGRTVIAKLFESLGARLQSDFDVRKLSEDMSEIDRVASSVRPKVYWRHSEAAYSEERAQFMRMIEVDGRLLAVADIPKDAGVDFVRFDPDDMPGVFSIHRIDLDGVPLDDLAGSVSQANEFMLPPLGGGQGVRIASVSDDPFVEFDLRRQQDGENRIVVLEIYFSQMDARRSLEERIEHLRAQLLGECAQLRSEMALFQQATRNESMRADESLVSRMDGLEGGLKRIATDLGEELIRSREVSKNESLRIEGLLESGLGRITADLSQMREDFAEMRAAQVALRQWTDSRGVVGWLRRIRS